MSDNYQTFAYSKEPYTTRHTTKPTRSGRSTITKYPIGVCGRVLKWKKVKLSIEEIKKLSKYCGDNIFNVIYTDKCYVKVPLIRWETQFFNENDTIIIEDAEGCIYEKNRKRR